MAGADYGVLGGTFKIVRMLQIISLLGCIGMAANFISEMVTNNDIPSKELIGTLSVVIISNFLYTRHKLMHHIRHASQFYTA